MNLSSFCLVVMWKRWSWEPSDAHPVSTGQIFLDLNTEQWEYILVSYKSGLPCVAETQAFMGVLLQFTSDDKDW